MSETHHEEQKLIEELIALDPTFRDQERELRVILKTLLANKPTVAIDSAFVSILRTSLTTKAHHQTLIPTPFDELLSVWMTRLMPVAALALVVLILIPGGESPRPAPHYAPYMAPVQKSVPAPDTFSLESAPAADTGMSSQDAAGTYTRMNVEAINTFGAPQVVDTYHIAIDSITLTAPSFLILQQDKAGTPGAVIGTSVLLPPGATDTTIITLTQPVVFGTTYHLSLYADTGDGHFGLDTDVPVYDPAIGTPISIPFVATPTQ